MPTSACRSVGFDMSALRGGHDDFMICAGLRGGVVGLKDRKMVVVSYRMLDRVRGAVPAIWMWQASLLVC